MSELRQISVHDVHSLEESVDLVGAFQVELNHKIYSHRSIGTSDDP